MNRPPIKPTANNVYIGSMVQTSRRTIALMRELNGSNCQVFAIKERQAGHVCGNKDKALQICFPSKNGPLPDTSPDVFWQHTCRWTRSWPERWLNLIPPLRGGEPLTRQSSKQCSRKVLYVPTSWNSLQHLIVFLAQKHVLPFYWPKAIHFMVAGSCTTNVTAHLWVIYRCVELELFALKENRPSCMHFCCLDLITSTLTRMWEQGIRLMGKFCLLARETLADWHNCNYYFMVAHGAYQ